MDVYEPISSGTAFFYVTAATFSLHMYPPVK